MVRAACTRERRTAAQRADHADEHVRQIRAVEAAAVGERHDGLAASLRTVEMCIQRLIVEDAVGDVEAARDLLPNRTAHGFEARAIAGENGDAVGKVRDVTGPRTEPTAPDVDDLGDA